MKIYIACALDGKSDWNKRCAFLARLQTLAIKLEKGGFKVVDYRECAKSAPQNQFPLDTNSVEIENFVEFADVVIALFDYPSLGFGEAASAAIRKHQKLCMGFVVRGETIPQYIPQFVSFIYEYDDFQDIEAVLKSRSYSVCGK